MPETATNPLPSPEDCPGADVVIFDGECAFCQAQVRRLRAWDGRGRLAFLSQHDPSVPTRFPQLHTEQLADQMFVVDRRGDPHGGAAAVRYLSRRLPRLWPLAPWLHLPGTFWLWQWLYRQVAKRRYRLNGQRCGGDACKVHLH